MDYGDVMEFSDYVTVTLLRRPGAQTGVSLTQSVYGLTLLLMDYGTCLDISWRNLKKKR